MSNLALATSIAEKKYDPQGDWDSDSVSSVSAESEPEDSSSRGEAQPCTIPKIRLLSLERIVGNMNSLYDVSKILRDQKHGDKPNASQKQ